MHYLVARLLAAEGMQVKTIISALKIVDVYGLILSMLGNCFRLLFFVSFYQSTIGFIVRVSNVLDQDQTQYF